MRYIAASLRSPLHGAAVSRHIGMNRLKQLILGDNS